MPNHVPLDQSKSLGARARFVRSQWLDAVNNLKELRNSMNAYLAATAVDSDFAPLVPAGFGSTNAEAHNGWNQLDTLLTAITTNASQTNVMDKLNQFIDFLGGN